MQKIRLLIHGDVVAPVLRLIQRRGVVELTPVEKTKGLYVEHTNGDYRFEYISSKLEFAVRLLSKYAPKRKTLAQLRTGGKIETTREEIESLVAHFPHEEIVQKLQDAEESYNRLSALIENVHNTAKMITPWISIDMPLSHIIETKTTMTRAFAGVSMVRAEVKARLEGTLPEHTYALYPISDSLFTVTIHKAQQSILKDIEKGLSLESIDIPHIDTAPKALLKELKEQKHLYETERKIAESHIRDQVTHLRELSILNDVIRWRKEKHAIISESPATQNTLIFEGWCPKDIFQTLQEDVYKETPFVDFSIIEPQEGEIPPVEIKNTGIIKPFESITRLYGLPGHTDIDPTVFLSGFFLIFFGLALTDVGYGITLSLITFFILSFFKGLSQSVRQLLWLLCFGGIASLIAGLFFGGYLGIDISLLPEWVQRIQRFDPIASPLPVLYLSLGLGIFQLLFGLLLNIYAEMKRDSFLEGVLSSGPWLLLFTFLILLGMRSVEIIHVASVTLFKNGIFASLVLLVLTQGRHEIGVFKKLLKGVLSLYDSVQYFSDVLSYSRILALGLATSALAFAVNLIAGIIGDMVPVVGGIFMVLILVIGHVFNVGVNVLGAFIHSARLQFVEFFGKFITGSGKQFMPFHQEERAIIIKE